MRVQNFDSLFLGLQKNEYFLKYEDFVDISGYYRKTGLFGGSFLCILGSFLKAKAQNGEYFGGLLKFQIFLGMLVIFVLGGGLNRRC